ncbi:MAG TPA: thioredoxin domain-containing protein [bacterium]
MPNRLAGAASSYLRSAAHQPVEWYPWSDEAFARAKAEDKPILLDIGAVWCHWCHVIDRESYENPEIAGIINAHFIPVKVDRDERPDIDVRYQHAVSAITGQGGWPLTAVLTPEGKVFFGGTYFPPDNAMGRPGFRQVLRAVAEFYRTKRDQANAYADELFQALHRLGTARASDDALDPRLVTEAAADIERQFDLQNGGFGGAPKFPHAGALELLLRLYDRTRDPQTLPIVTRTLEKMGRGGVYDQLGGGFHRYSVDASWIVPHFEKMIYDNSEILRNYVHAYQATGSGLFREIAEGILGYAMGTLSDGAQGGFFGSQDADQSLEDDGDFYTWTPEEAAAVLPPEELAVVSRTYRLDGPGEMHHDPRRHVLFVDKDADAVGALLERPVAGVQDLLARGKQRLLAARGKRPAPQVDRTVYSGWNGMMISAFLEAARGFDRPDVREFALRALDRVVRDAYRPGQGFRHAASAPDGVSGLLDDQVHMARALLDAFEHTGDPRSLGLAEETMAYVLREFPAPWGALYDTARPASAGAPGVSGVTRGIPAGLGLPYVPVQDSPTPSGNAVAALVLDRLAILTGEARYRDAAEQVLRACVPGNAAHGLFAASLLLALDLHVDPPLHVVVVGPRRDPAVAALHRAALATYRPGAVVHLHDPSASAGRLPSVIPPAAAGGPAPRAYVCTATECAPPTAAPEELRETMLTFGRVPVA